MTLLLSILLLVGLTDRVSADFVAGPGWSPHNLGIYYGNLWDQFTNRNYGGYNHALQWPGGPWDVGTSEPVERRTYANYKGFIIGAVDVQDPQYPDLVWPYMVGQRDGWNDGEMGTDWVTTKPDPLAISKNTQFLFKGRLARRTYRQRLPEITVNGEAGGFLGVVEGPDEWFLTWPEIVGDESDAPYQRDAVDPDLPADVTFESYTWTRMGVANNRMIYAFSDRNNDDYMFWHWRLVNDGHWSRMGPLNTVDCCGGTHGTVDGVMLGLMFQWDRSSAGAYRTSSAGEWHNDSIWRYYGVDYDGARTEDMRLVYVIDGDQDPSVYSPAHSKQDDIGDPDPTTGDLLSAKTGGWQILHYDASPTDRRDDPAQPRTLGWQNYDYVIRTGTANTQHPGVGAGHEAKYNQMLLGYQGEPDEYYPGSVQETPGRGVHPYAAQGASWIKTSNDPATSGAYWPGKVLGVDTDVTDVEQQAGFGPDDLAPFDTLNAIFALGVKGLDEPYAIQVGREWLAGALADYEKDSLVHSTIDSLFQTMRQAKAVYESAQFDDGFGGMRHASSRAEFEESLQAAVDAGELTLSPPAPASFSVAQGPGRVDMEWTLNTTTGSNIAGWRIYRAMGSMKGDSAWTMIAELPPSDRSYADYDVAIGYPYYYYLTTYDANGGESTMHTRTYDFVTPDPELGITSPHQPFRFHLSQNAPNPFNPNTSVRFGLTADGPARLAIYSISGQQVRLLVDQHMTVGEHEIVWDGADDHGRAVASGTYIYRLTSGSDVAVRRMTVVR